MTTHESLFPDDKRGIVTITNRPFVTVRLGDVYIEEWPEERIAQYGADLLLWERFGYTRTLAQRRFTGRLWRWAADRIGVPETRPHDRDISITGAFINGTHRPLAGIFVASETAVRGE